MSGFLKRNTTNTVNPAGGVNPASTPNVGQYGWTSYDAANVNQLIQYVNMAQEAAISAKESADFVSGKFQEVESFIQYVEEAYERLKPILDNLTVLYEDVVKKHGEVVTMHTDVRTWSVLSVTAAQSAQDARDEARAEVAKAEASATAAAISATSAKASEVGSEDWYNKSKEIYDDLKEGQVYQGTWNPTTNAYPTKPTTNSAWDVSLPSGTASHTFDGKVWRSGDRLLYVLVSDKFEQIAVGGGVDSVNGKTGAVTLSATDVGALSNTGGIITGAVQISGDYTFRLTDSNNNNVRLVNSGAGYIQAGHSTDDTNQRMYLSGMNGKGLTELRYVLSQDVTPIIRWGSTSHKIYHEGNKPTPAAIGALGVAGNQTVSGALAAVKFTASDTYGYVSATRPYQGIYMGKTDADRRTIIGGGADAVGDGTGSVIIRPNGITDTAGNTVFNGDGTITSNVDGTNANHLTRKGYVDAQVKIVNDKVDAIGPDAINAMPKSGGTFTGQVSLAPATMGALIVSDKASIMYRDGGGSWMHQQANGNSIRWAHGSNADNTMAELLAGGDFHTQGPQFALVAHVARSRDKESWIGIESPDGAAPYISSKTPAEATTSIALRFGQTEVSVESGKRLAAGQFRVQEDGGLRFAPTNDISGLTWGMGVNATLRSFGLHAYNNGVYERQVWNVTSNGDTDFYGPITRINGKTHMNSYATITSGTNNILEFHQPGHSAAMIYKPVNSHDIRLGKSTGAGGEASFYANFSETHAHFRGSVKSEKSSSRVWSDIGNTVFYGSGSVASPGLLSALVSQWLTIPNMAAYEHGYGFLSDQSGNIGNYCHVLWCNDGGSYQKEWIFRNNGGQQSPSNFSIDPDGRMSGNAYEGYDDHFHWATTSLGTVSDERLKTVLGNTTKSAVDIVNQFQFKRFVWNEKAGKVYNERSKKVTEIGLIAQEVEAIDPTLIKTIKVSGDNPHDTKTLDTAGMLALALKAIQEQQVQINELKEKLNEFILK